MMIGNLVVVVVVGREVPSGKGIPRRNSMCGDTTPP